jgi:hypothetical protein
MKVERFEQVSDFPEDGDFRLQRQQFLDWHRSA